MAVTSYTRGNLCEYTNNGWVYSSDKIPIDNVRACTKCGQMPTSEGYDACLGYIPNAKFACCGHGVSKRLISYLNNTIL